MLLTSSFSLNSLLSCFLCNFVVLNSLQHAIFSSSYHLRAQPSFFYATHTVVKGKTQPDELTRVVTIQATKRYNLKIEAHAAAKAPASQLVYICKNVCRKHSQFKKSFSEVYTRASVVMVSISTAATYGI